MTTALAIALRYIFSKKKVAVINIISIISVIGVAISSAAMIIILSVFNGFEQKVSSLFTAFDPQLKIVPKSAPFVIHDEAGLEALKTYEGIDVYCEILEDNALVSVNNRQMMIRIKGIEDNFTELVDVDQIKLGQGYWCTHIDVIDYCIPGIGILQQLGFGLDFPMMTIYAPKQGEKIDLNDPLASFNKEELYSAGLCFNVRQAKYDHNVILTSIGFARRLFEHQGFVSSVEIKLKRGYDINKAKQDIKHLVGSGYDVLDRYEQQEDTFRIMEVEKLISYIFLTFILLIACFNIVSSLSMLIIDKQNDIKTLRSLGASNNLVSRIFMLQGFLISSFGAIIGIALGASLCLIQQHYGIISLGSSEALIMDAYPVSLQLPDILLVVTTTILVGFLISLIPTKRINHLTQTQ